MAKKRPDWIRCVRTGIDGDTVSWCGRNTFREFAFTDAAHASLNGRDVGRLVACPECVTKIVEALRNGHESLDDGEG